MLPLTLMLHHNQAFAAIECSSWLHGGAGESCYDMPVEQGERLGAPKQGHGIAANEARRFHARAPRAATRYLSVTDQGGSPT